MFISPEPTPPVSTISLPKGQKLRIAILKHCIPTGIPIIEMHQTIPAPIQPSPPTKPPQHNHIILPKQLIFSPFLTKIVHSKYKKSKGDILLSPLFSLLYKAMC